MIKVKVESDRVKLYMGNASKLNGGKGGVGGDWGGVQFLLHPRGVWCGPSNGPVPWVKWMNFNYIKKLTDNILG